MKNKASYKDYLIYSLWFIAIFAVSYIAIYALGLVPKELNESGKDSILDTLRYDALNSVSSQKTRPSVSTQEAGDMPIHIKIPNTNVDILVQNPNTTDPVLLDEYLKKGVVRYPGSGLLGNGNVLLFGHSTNWKVVQNQSYKALNGIENLKTGDEIYVDAENARYVYKTRSVRMAPAEEVMIDFSKNENLLTISTCNTFGAKQDRYILEAVFDRKETKI